MHLIGEKSKGRSLYNKLRIDGKLRNLESFPILGEKTPDFFSWLLFNLFSPFVYLKIGTICVILKEVFTSRECHHRRSLCHPGSIR